MNDTIPATGHLLGTTDIRCIAVDAGISPTKKFGQNFAINPGMVRCIVHEAGVTAADHVIEVDPGLGSLMLAILGTDVTMAAVEINPPLAKRLPGTVAKFMPEAASRLTIVSRDVLIVTPEDVSDFSDDVSFTLVANLLYNAAMPILLTLLERFDDLGSFLVMVQKEVAGRLAVRPGSRIYGAPSVKLVWYGTVERVGTIGRGMFWPAPNMDSVLVKFIRYQADNPTALGTTNSTGDDTQRELVFHLIDAVFGQRCKTPYAALKTIALPEAFSIAGTDPARQGETFTTAEFAALARAIELCEDGDGAQWVR